jgi:hypothetical protein
MTTGVQLGADLSKVVEEIRTVDKQFATSIRKQVRNAVNSAGVGLVTDMQRRASWSSRIPSAVGMRTSFSASRSGITIRVDHKKAPHALPLEKGNTNTFSEDVINRAGGFVKVNGKRVAKNRYIYSAMKRSGIGVGRALRHPVFHKKGMPGGYATMPTRPFFYPAIDGQTAEIVNKIDTTLQSIIADEAGFKGD